MRQLFSAHPAGLAGAALLLFRCALALFVATSATELLSLRHWSVFVVDVLAISLAAGFSTRFIAALASFAGITLLVLGRCAMPMLLFTQVLNAAALAMIGPGAFSIDAHVFGRATIRLPQ